jgi:hypothetical protein
MVLFWQVLKYTAVSLFIIFMLMMIYHARLVCS